MNTFKHFSIGVSSLALTTFLTACGGGSGYGGSDNDNDYGNGGNPPPPPPGPTFTVVETINDINTKSSTLLSRNPAGPGGSSNQSLRAGDVLQAEIDTDSTLIGGLGVDILVGNNSNDILIGGTEDFNSSVDGDDRGSDNRDRAFGNAGEDVFIWAPGDGSDFFDGGDDIDVLVFGILGEEQDSDGTTDGAPFFNVNPPGSDGSQDFDGIFLDAENRPVVDVSNSPGFCTVLDASDSPAAFAQLGVDHIVRFTLRNIANDFDANLRDDDDGLRVAVTATNVEFLVCTSRETGIEVLDLTVSPPAIAELSDLPPHVAELVL